MTERKWSTIVLAAGKGTRMKSAVPKVMHRLLGKPLIGYVAELLEACGIISRSVFVVGHGRDDVRMYLSSFAASTVVQEDQLGTAHAVLCACEHLSDRDDSALILCGDTPLLKKETILSFLLNHETSGNSVSILTAHLDEPTGYGRIVRDGQHQDRVVRIVEENDASADEKRICEINSGIYAVDTRFLFDALESVRTNNAQKEYYLTDIVGIAVSQGREVGAMRCTPEEIMGINSREQLSEAEGVLLDRLRTHWMNQGVTFELADTIYVEPSVRLASDVTIGPHVILTGNTEVGIGASVGAFSYLDNAHIEPGAALPPYSRIVDAHSSLLTTGSDTIDA